MSTAEELERKRLEEEIRRLEDQLTREQQQQQQTSGSSAQGSEMFTEEEVTEYEEVEEVTEEEEVEYVEEEIIEEEIVEEEVVDEEVVATTNQAPEGARDNAGPATEKAPETVGTTNHAPEAARGNAVPATEKAPEAAAPSPALTVTTEASAKKPQVSASPTKPIREEEETPAPVTTEKASQVVPAPNRKVVRRFVRRIFGGSKDGKDKTAEDEKNSAQQTEASPATTTTTVEAPSIATAAATADTTKTTQPQPADDDTPVSPTAAKASSTASTFTGTTTKTSTSTITKPAVAPEAATTTNMTTISTGATTTPSNDRTTPTIATTTGAAAPKSPVRGANPGRIKALGGAMNKAAYSQSPATPPPFKERVIPNTIPVSPAGSETPLEKMVGPKLIINSKMNKLPTAACMDGQEIVLLYFAASWRTECKRFAPVIADFYYTASQANKMECIFVPSCRTLIEFKDYFGRLPFLAMPSGTAEYKNQLTKQLCVVDLPSLAVVEVSTGNIITISAVEQLEGLQRNNVEQANELVQEWKSATPIPIDQVVSKTPVVKGKLNKSTIYWQS